MASTDAKPIPIRAAAYRVTFPILDADGDLVAGASSLDSEFSEDGVAFADCTNEATEIATSSGMYFLDLANTEMDGDTVAVIIKSASGKTTPIVMYPNEGGDIDVDTTFISGSAVSTSAAQIGVNVINAAGTAWNSGAIGAATLAADTIAAAKIATGAITSAKFAAGAIDAAAIATDAIGAAEIADGAITAATFAAGAIDAAAIATDAIGAAELADGAITAATFAAGAIDATAIATGAIDADALAADAGTELSAAVWAQAIDEPAGVVAWSGNVLDALEWLTALARNKITQTATTQTLRNDADDGNIATAAVSDDATTAIRAEWA
jgi:CheY-like chemotaxis protein